ncbi:hypothetical protein BDD12DRAFT_885191 [Trichophaea hybrida]|nr:hypothetical protein BDD12DRAFT_885191 [Trichophaea hybrida]
MVFRHSAPSPTLPDFFLSEDAAEASNPIRNVPQGRCYVCLENACVDENTGLCRDCFPGCSRMGSGFDMVNSKYKLHPREPESEESRFNAIRDLEPLSVERYPVHLGLKSLGTRLRRSGWDDNNSNAVCHGGDDAGEVVDTAEKLGMEYRKLLPRRDTVFWS